MRDEEDSATARTDKHENTRDATRMMGNDAETTRTTKKETRLTKSNLTLVDTAYRQLMRNGAQEFVQSIDRHWSSFKKRKKKKKKRKKKEKGKKTKTHTKKTKEATPIQPANQPTNPLSNNRAKRATHCVCAGLVCLVLSVCVRFYLFLFVGCVCVCFSTQVGQCSETQSEKKRRLVSLPSLPRSTCTELN